MRLLHLTRVRKRVVDGDLRRGPPEAPAETTAAQHVTTEQLKRQFQERLAARTRRRST